MRSILPVFSSTIRLTPTQHPYLLAPVSQHLHIEAQTAVVVAPVEGPQDLLFRLELDQLARLQVRTSFGVLPSTFPLQEGVAPAAVDQRPDMAGTAG